MECKPFNYTKMNINSLCLDSEKACATPVDIEIDIGKSKGHKFVSCFLTKVLLRCILSEWTINEVRDFFFETGLPEGLTSLTSREFYELIWDVKNSIPLEYLSRIFQKLQSYLASRGECLEELLEKTAKEGYLYEPRSMLWMLSKSMDQFLLSSDVSIGIIKFIAVIYSVIYPDYNCLLEKYNVMKNGVANARFSFMFKRPLPANSIEWVSLHYFHKYLPTLFRCPPFEECYSLCESGTAVDIAGQYNHAYMTDEMLFIDGKRYGKTVTFGEYAAEADIRLPCRAFQRKKVIIVEEDFYCAVRKRNVLRKGVAYGAPMVLFDINFKMSGKSCLDALVNLASDILSSPSGKFVDIEKKYNELLQVVDISQKITFDSSQNALFWNNRRLTKGVQAKLLLEILRFLFERNRREFHRHELASNPDFIIDSFSTGLNVRIDRALELAKSFHPFIIIEKKARGYYSIACSGKVEFVIN